MSEFEFKTYDQMNDEITRIGEEISEITDNSPYFWEALENLLKAQDRKTAAQIDCAACGRTETDRLRQTKAELAFEQQLLSFLKEYVNVI